MEMKIFKNNSSGNLHILNYLDGNVLHREDGPASVEFRDGKIIKEMFYVKGVLHRNKGPAIINYDENGDVLSEAYYHNGTLVTSTKHLIELESLWT